MFRLISLVVSIGIADSLNPTTIAPALYLASGEHARRNVAHFTLGVFVIYMIGGAAVALGPGELVLDLIPHPHHVARHVIEIVAGAIMLLVAALVWRNRVRLAARAKPDPDAPPQSRSSLLLGATITAVELPTAFPYFAAIAAILGSGTNPGGVLLLLVLFNVCFVLPLLGILATLWLAGDRATEILTRWRVWLQRRWPMLLAGAALLAGAISIFVGVSGLIVGTHGRIGNLARNLRSLLHLSTKP
jgi:cytochrome c biogenesis protein CcdA